MEGRVDAPALDKEVSRKLLFATRRVHSGATIMISIVTEDEYGFQMNASTDKSESFKGNAVLKAHWGEDGFHESGDNTYTKNKFVVVLVGLNELTILVNNVDIHGVVQAEVHCHNLPCTQFNLTTELVDTLLKL